MKSKIKGYTLVELLVVTGVLSLAAIGVYTVAGVASDWRKSSQEVKSLNMAIKEIDNSTVTAGAYTGITLSSLNSVSSGISSNLQLRDVVSPEANKLNFVYADVNSRVCGDFTSKMLSSSNNIGAIINGKEINSSNLGEVVSACSSTGGLNNVTIVLNKTQNSNVIDNVVASVNPPPGPVPDIVIPTFGGPTTLPSVPGFVPSTANPVTYPLITGTPPTFGPVVGGGGNVTVTSPGGQVTPSKPSVPTWIPPNVYRPPATPAPADALDQDPNPPPPPPSFYSKQIKSCISGYAVDNMTFNCSNGMVSATLTLTLASPWDTFGRENFIFPAGLEHCNTGEAGFQIGYNQIYPQTTDVEMFWGATSFSNPRKMFIKTFNNINSYIFTCSQTG